MILVMPGVGNLFRKGHLNFSPRAIVMQKRKTNKKVYNYCDTKPHEISACCLLIHSPQNLHT